VSLFLFDVKEYLYLDQLGFSSHHCLNAADHPAEIFFGQVGTAGQAKAILKKGF
jgi:hypothetical protein